MGYNQHILAGITGGAASPSPFLDSAQKIMDRYNNPNTLMLADPAPTIDISNIGNSTINGRSLAAGGVVPTASMSDGHSGPLNANSKWIVTKPSGALTYAPGNSKLFTYTGQKFDFKGSIIAGVSFSVRYSEDGGQTWLLANEDPIVLTQTCWCLIDFGSAASRVIEVIGEDEIFEMFGFNFQGSTIVGTYTDSTLPLGMAFGDSYVFCQGTRSDSIAHNQQATLGMTRKSAEYMGCLQIYNNGFRTNGFCNNHAGVQCYFEERIDFSGAPEGSVWGPLDYVIIPGTINDLSALYNAIRYDLVVEAFHNLRTLQPTALIIFPIGACPPQQGEPAAWITDYENAFYTVFGATEGEQIQNGAIMLNGSRLNGDAWVPAGALGSSPYFYGTGDVEHPNAAGHDFFGQLYAQGVIDLATAIIG